MQVGNKCMWTLPQTPKKARITDGPIGWAYELGGLSLRMYWQWEIKLPTGKTKWVPATEIIPG